MSLRLALLHIAPAAEVPCDNLDEDCDGSDPVTGSGTTGTGTGSTGTGSDVPTTSDRGCLWSLVALSAVSRRRREA